MDPLTVGELAKRLRISVRTLHHYEAVGLLEASQRTASNHRRYAARDVERLERVVALRRLGFALEDIRRLLEGEAEPVVARHLARLKESLLERTRLVSRLERLANPPRRFMVSLEESARWQRGLTSRQRVAVEERAAALGRAGVARIEQRWLGAIDALRASRDAGLSPHSKEVRAIARRLRSASAAFAGKSKEVQETLLAAWRGGAGLAYGLEAELVAFLRAAGD
jgi:DNA-binding transcriptional MerR regulator